MTQNDFEKGPMSEKGVGALSAQPLAGFVLQAEQQSESAVEEAAPLELDLGTSVWTELLAQAPVYAKTGTVRARMASPGEVVRTVLADGTEETVNIAGEDDVVITGVRGEEYIIGREKFWTRYQESDTEGVYRAKGMVRAVANPTGQAVVITAPWGEQQFGGVDCMVATIYDPAAPDEVSTDRYIIAAAEFAETYGLAAERTE